MASNRITRGATMRRALATVASTIALAALLLGCGGGGTSTATPAGTAPGSNASQNGDAHEVSTPMPSPQESADAELLDKVLARQEAAVGAYTTVIPTLAPSLAQMAAYFRAQEQEHIDATIKVLRGLGSPAEATPEPLDVSELKGDRERLEFLYEVESATIDEELSAIANLEAPWPRSLLASTVADQAQHLSLLRRALGAGPLASVPEPFENGTAPPPTQ